MGLYKDIKLFFQYRKTINENEIDLGTRFNIRIDNANRMYTVLNIPDDLFQEPYNVNKRDIDTIAQNYIREYVKELGNYLNSKGLSEMYDYYQPIQKVDKYSYLLVIGFKPIDTVSLNKFFWRFLVPTTSILTISTFLYLLF